MPNVDIESLAGKVAHELLKAVPGLPAATSVQRGMIITHVLHSSKGAGATLVSAFKDDPAFGDLRGGWMQRPGGEGGTIQGHAVPHRLVDSIILGKSAKPLIEQARAFAASPRSVAELYAPVAGATVGATVSLGENVDLVPWAEVPDAEQKRVFNSIEPSHESMSSLLAPLSFRATANMAVRIRLPDCQVLFPSREMAQEAWEAAVASTTERSEQLRDVVRCITLQSERAVAVLGQWSRFEKEIANDIFGTGYHFNGALLDTAFYFASRNPDALEADSITHLFRRFEALERSARDPLRISVDRFNQALRRTEMVDKAIDLGIALEIMLLHDIDPVELMYRLSIRGAMFLGGDKETRLTTFKLLKDTYGLRSKAVHTGALKSKKNEQPPKQKLEEATSVCARIARKLIERGSFPDWETEYLIGGG